MANGAKKLSDMRNVLSKQATQRMMPPLQSAQKAYRSSSNYIKKKISQAGDIKLAPKKVRVVEEPITGTRMPVVDEWITGKDVGRMFSVSGEGSTNLQHFDTGSHTVANAKNNRIEYLRSKYGKFTSEELHQRINLRDAVAKEVERLDKLGLTNKQMGPAVAGTFDKTTGKYYFGINNTRGDVPEILHPTIDDRINNMPEDVLNGYTFTYGAGSHAEVYSLNQALLANPNANPDNFITHVVRSGKKLKPAGMMMPTCPHCNFITEGFEFSSEVKKH
ncbi:YwqJ-related putative deaminase [Priestia aryabhattai]|uniref:YwqJ-related putative deaminase n=1 Tax=Priestia aryabhattai TaxID=412384 RepID=UPI0029CA9C6B|nr:YwqJ-related putative deaminase [Priestia aryabhattai]